MKARRGTVGVDDDPSLVRVVAEWASAGFTAYVVHLLALVVVAAALVVWVVAPMSKRAGIPFALAPPIAITTVLTGMRFVDAKPEVFQGLAWGLGPPVSYIGAAYALAGALVALNGLRAGRPWGSYLGSMFSLGPAASPLAPAVRSSTPGGSATAAPGLNSSVVPACPQCAAPMEWRQQYSKHFCGACRVYA